ncbi:hypothetical protein JM47_03420 [Ureaplasma diversum]|uniref:Uncharacterized protein n=2 Tax=Ureaplasma diversum TaxID=42094 RepID=A0A084EWN3_9BACT|nr:hypothetical protein [Ureaplasma diversum]AJQ45577.1 hypothetical protein JM47_03420 [Ureaplasma diversum]KEZ22375.1 Hypothetical protein, predicted transmembrane protein [Ureaplasma diversum NCTC 246]
MIRLLLKIIKWLLIIIGIGGAGVVVGWFANQAHTNATQRHRKFVTNDLSSEKDSTTKKINLNKNNENK